MIDENIHIGNLLKSFTKQWKIYVPIGVICFIGAVIFILATPKEYLITSQMQLLGDKKGMISELNMLKSSGLGNILGGSGSSVNAEGEIEIITSRHNYSTVIQKTNYQIETTTRKGLKKVLLDKEESPLSYTFPTSFLDTISKPIVIKIEIKDNQISSLSVKSALFKNIKIKNQSFPYKLELPVGDIYISCSSKIKNTIIYKTKIIPLQKAYEVLGEKLFIKPSKMSDIITFRYETSNKQKGCNLINAVMDQYNIYTRAIKENDAALNSTFVRERLDSVTFELAVLEHKIEQYKQKNSIPDPVLYGKTTYLGNQEVENTILETEIRLHTLDYIIKYMQNPSNTYSSIPIIDEAGEKAMEVYNELILNRQRLLQTSEKSNPTLLLIENQLQEQRKILFETIENIRKGLQISLNQFKKKNAKLINLVDKLPTHEREYVEMKRQQKIKESMYLFLMQKLQEKELINSPEELAGRIIDKAYASYKHTYPKGTVVMIAAFLIACILSIIMISIKCFALNK
ncbi:GumC family protein [Bacteroides sp.]